MKPFFYKFWRNAIDSFRGKNLFWHILAILLTYLLVTSDFDWVYFSFFQGTLIYPFFLFGAGLLGFIFPVILPALLLINGTINRNIKQINTAWAVAQASMLALFVSWFYKAFTGRPSPLHPLVATTVDISKVFHFGFLRGGVFFGWPSSHTAVAFALSTVLIILYPKNKRRTCPP